MLWPPGFKANILTLISSNSDDSNSDGKDGSSDDITALEFSSRIHIITSWNPKAACNTIWNTLPHLSSLSHTVQQILTCLLLWRWNVFPIIDFGTMNMKKVTRSLDRLQFPRKVKKNVRNTSPEITPITVQQFSTTIGEMRLCQHSWLLRYHNEYIHHVHCAMSTVFWENILVITQ